jgi:hypothetical protein
MQTKSHNMYSHVGHVGPYNNNGGWAGREEYVMSQHNDERTRTASVRIVPIPLPLRSICLRFWVRDRYSSMPNDGS